MTAKKKSILKGIKLMLLVIFILAAFNYGFKKYFSSKIIDKENKVVLIDKVLILIDYSSTQLKSGEIKNSEEYLSVLKTIQNNINLLAEGGKYKELIQTNKISSVNSGHKQILKEISKKLKKNQDIILKNEEIGTRLSAKNQNIILSNINYTNQKLNKIKKDLKNSISSITLIKNLIDILTLILIVICAFLIFLKIKNELEKNIELLNTQLSKLSNFEDISKPETDEEFQSAAEKIYNFNTEINEITHFVNNLLSDNYETEFKQTSENNIVKQSLNNLKNKLKENITLNNKRLEEEHKRQWFAEGLAKFNEILREASSGIKNLAETSLINMVKFLNAAQGGFFIVNDYESKPYLELISAFAYDRIKMLTKRIEFGDGLVGMCALEKNTILVDDVPEDYMLIESGLGEAAPKNILIIPLKTDENILGVIEIASFYKFKKEEIEFIENIAEDIAKTLKTTKITDKTAELLTEMQKKSEELALRDSEMSEKINQLRDAQKETIKSESEINALISVIDKVLFKTELTTAGKISSVNNLFLNRLGYRLSEVKNKGFIEFIKNKDKKLPEEIYNEIAKNNFAHKEVTFITKNNTELKTDCFFSSVRNEKGDVTRIIMLADNTTFRDELKKQNELLKKELSTKVKLISEKEKEISKIFNDKKITEDFNIDEIKSLKNREAEIKNIYETESDKKYAKWLKDIINKK